MVKPECRLWGEYFSPKKIMDIPKIEIVDIIERGKIGDLGRYKNRQTPYGACRIITPKEIGQNDRINWMAEFISSHIKVFQKEKATNIVFGINWYGPQGNMELSVEQLTKIAQLNIPLSMNYFFNEVI